MIDRQEAERIAAEWARQESLRRGYECTPMLSEFDLGYIVWTTSQQPCPTPSKPPMPGDGVTTIIDKETGQISSWPGLPPPVVCEQYRHQRVTILPPVTTVDPAVEKRRNAHRRPTPTVTATLTLHYKQYKANGAKGDQQLRHHWLVREYLDDLPAGHLVRGGERHAELIVLSNVLHALDRGDAGTGHRPQTAEDARQILGNAYLEAVHVREPRDPKNRQPAPPCDSCLKTLIYFGILPWSHLAYIEETPAPPPTGTPHPGRFPDDVASVLVEGGWAPRDTDNALAQAAIEQACAISGQQHQHVPFPAVKQALTDFPGLVCGRRGPGRQHWIQPFEINPVAAAYSAAPLADLAALIGARLFPIGSENNGETMLAIDERGRVFALDQAGEWFIGDTMDTALINLVTGAPMPRVHDDGTWH